LKLFTDFIGIEMAIDNEDEADNYIQEEKDNDEEEKVR
jgi:hypothetical protein